MLGKDITIVGREHLVYKIVEFSEANVVIRYKSGPFGSRDIITYTLSRATFDLNYNSEQNSIDMDNLTLSNDDKNEAIRTIRGEQYKQRADDLYMAWQKYLYTNDERATQAKQAWLDEVERINLEFPYFN